MREYFREYSPKDLMVLLYSQAFKLVQIGIVEKSTISPAIFRDGLLNIADKIESQQIKILTDTKLPILLVMPLRMLPLSDLISIAKIDYDEEKINLRELQFLSSNRPIETETLHALVDIKTHYVERGLTTGKVDEVFRHIIKNQGFGLDFAQAISLVYFYPELLENEQIIDVVAHRINGHVLSLACNDTGKVTIFSRPHWEASPHNLIAPYFQVGQIVTAEN